MNDDQHRDKARDYWDTQAATFDDEPDHGLRNSVVRQAWTDRLTQWLPPPPATILDAGCGTGSLSSLLADLGYRVTAIDLSPAMIAQAKQKAGNRVDFHVMEASNPQFPPRTFDIVLCRHILWALPQPAQVLQRWSDLLTPGGRLVLIEGFWHTGSGLHAEEILTFLPQSLKNVFVDTLDNHPDLWGKEVADERYAVIANLGPPHSG